MPAGTAGPGGEVFQFASTPVESEMTGPYFTPDGKTLFISVQHPGEDSESTDKRLAHRRRQTASGRHRHNRRLRLDSKSPSGPPSRTPRSPL